MTAAGLARYLMAERGVTRNAGYEVVARALRRGRIARRKAPYDVSPIYYLPDDSAQ